MTYNRNIGSKVQMVACSTRSA